ncbi:hypothetical protein MGU_07292 [Metarhizium guizhouense ARSEF 977]|uniref:Uncharacterized protein n=1 Tax=Metarhizium guizhouense (strain ARSEF 977) TaxID=1276136 RepID=A0A0B4H743_METGA|nr:hypothetical protein MGU_07292 [Metarhizium guizhouense ARSEF 977]
MAGLAMANPLAASTKTARGYITNDEFKYLRVALVSCLEANPHEDAVISSWATSIASKYNTVGEIVQAIVDCEAKEKKAKQA